MYLVNVYIEHPIFKIDQVYTYYTYYCEIAKGKRVLVDFNHQKEIVGFVSEIFETTESLELIEKKLGYEIKPILVILDENTLLNEELFNLGLWMAKETISPTISCFKAMLPPYIKPSSNKLKIIKNQVCNVNPDFCGALTVKQKEFLSLVSPNIKLSELRKKSASITNKLIDKNAIIVKEVELSKPNIFDYTSNLKSLTNEQNECLQKIINGDNQFYLIHGVTGSGKTEVYLHLANEIIKRGKQVLILVPEISLTPMMIKRVSGIFGNDVAYYHSGLTNREKYNQYKLVLNNEVKIVVGTRSSVFMPFNNLGLIIIDEEHDQSYKQDSTPCYNTIDVAKKRAAYFNSKLVLASATPSLDTYARALKGLYCLCTLNKRVNSTLPEINLVNMNEVIKNSGNYMISNVLKDAISDTLLKHEQAIILLNRRGYTSVYKCSKCNEVIKCDHCDVAMSYHKDENALKCHVCGAIKPLPKVCPKCNNKMFSSFGFGTQKVEETLHRMFSNAKICRMDYDTTNTKNAHSKILSAFENHDFDILLGTQMIAKGLDFPLVNLVGIINGDAGLNRYDFRSVENTFNLIVQASGRSGRSNSGKVILQVYNSEHYAIQAAIKHDYVSFFKQEMQYRKLGQYPPYTYLIAIYIQDINLDRAHRSMDFFKSLFVQSEFKILGPSLLNKLSDINRLRLLIKGKDLEKMKELVNRNIRKYLSKGAMSNIKVDVNPLYLE